MTDSGRGIIPKTETDVLCLILCHMLNFITRTKVLGSINIASSKEKVIHATIFELCDRLLLPDMDENTNKFEDSILITFRYFASPTFLLSLLVFRFMTLTYNCWDERTVLRVQLRCVNWVNLHI